MRRVDSSNRNLLSTVADGYTSTLSSSATTGYYSNTPVVFKVQAKDILGNNIITGGDKFVIQIKNECTMDVNNNCVTNSGAAVVVNPEIQSYMTDNLDGTYSYTFTPTSTGKLTVLVFLESNTAGVYGEFWNNINLAGNVDKTCYYTSLNLAWNSLVTTTSIAPTSGRLTTYLTVPQDGTYTIYYFHDNGGRLYFSGSPTLSNWANLVSEESFTITLNTATKYSIVAEFFNTGGPAQAILSWSYTGQTKTTIPPSAFTYKAFTNSSPLSVSVTPQCGNGFRVSGESCDDGNTTDGDGCSNQCIVESNYTCIGGSPTSKDVCTKNSIPSSPNPSSIVSPAATTTQVSPSDSKYIEIILWIFLALLISSALLNITSLYFSGYSNGSIFSLINQVQLILLLPMLPTFMADNVKNFIASLNYCLFSFDFINLNINSVFETLNINLDYKQPDSYLNSIDLDSGSGIVNILSNLLCACFLVSLHLCLLAIIYFIPKDKADRGFYKFIHKIFKSFTFGCYITYAICSYLILILISSSEIYRLDSTSSRRSVSLSISFIILLLCISFIIFIFYKWHEAKQKTKLQNMKFTRNFFESIKDSNVARFNILKYLIQRFLLCVIAVFWTKGNIYIKLTVYLIIHLHCFVYIAIVRPFDNIKENCFEIVNDGFYVVLIILLFYCNTESTWTKTFEVLYISIIFL